MIIYNRRKRSQYYAERTALLQKNLIAAIEADRAGIPLTEDQVLLLNRERARMEGEERAKAKKDGGWRRWIFGGLSGSSEREGEGNAATDGRGEGSGQGVLSAIQEETRQVFRDGEEKPSTIVQAVEEKRREGEKTLEAAGISGGPLDQLADQAVQEAGRAKGGWTSWMIRKD